MARPSKPLAVVKSHLTNAEKAHRKKAEEQSKTGEVMFTPDELKGNKFALKEFNRIKKLYAKIDHDDEMHVPTIARYCIMRSEENELLLQKDKVELLLAELSEKKSDMEFLAYMDMSAKLQKNYMNVLNCLARHRKMLLDLEKTSLMTLAEKIKAIPKKPEEKQESEMAKFLRAKKG